MIFGIGIDQLEVRRMNEKLEKDDLMEKLFSANEIEYCTARSIPAQHFAARFCAKEAFLKAMGTGWQGGFEFYDIEVLNDVNGKPAIHLHGAIKNFMEELNVSSIHVSMSHLKEIASSIVIIEK